MLEVRFVTLYEVLQAYQQLAAWLAAITIMAFPAIIAGVAASLVAQRLGLRRLGLTRSRI